MNHGINAEPLVFRQLALPSDVNSIHTVEKLVEEVRAELEFKDDVFANVMVAVTEAVNNSIMHGNQQDQTKKVYVEIETVGSYRLMIRIHDEGPGFNPVSLPDPTAPENIGKPGGRGVFLMGQLSDKLTISDDGKMTEMMFNI